MEELLRKRFKVIADYPTSLLYMSVGDILTQTTETSVTGGKNDLNMSVETVEKYPHIFKRLEWYEERRPEEMPEYLKYLTGGNKIVKGKYRFVENELYYEWDNNDVSHLSNFTIATPHEYTEFINRNKI